MIKIGVKYWTFCPEIESFQWVFSLQRPRPLTDIYTGLLGWYYDIIYYIECAHTRSVVIGESPMKVYWLHTQQKDDGQNYFMMGSI